MKDKVAQYNESANPRRRALAIHMHGTVIGGRAGPFLIQLVVAYQLAESQLLAFYTTRTE